MKYRFNYYCYANIIFRYMYLQPSLPTAVTHASVIGNSVYACCFIFTLVVDTLVDVKRTIVFRVPWRAFADITVRFIETVTTVFAIYVEAKLTTDTLVMRGIIFPQCQILERREISVLIDLFICEVMQQHAANSYLA